MKTHYYIEHQKNHVLFETTKHPSESKDISKL